MAPDQVKSMFPSPLGVLYLQINKGVPLEKVVSTVSVPSRGSLSSNDGSSSTFRNSYVEFPSPLGVLYLQIQTGNTQGVL